MSEWEKEFDELWQHWVNLSGIKTGVNFGHFKNGIKWGVVKYFLEKEIRKLMLSEEEIRKIIMANSEDEGRYVSDPVTVDSQYVAEKIIKVREEKIGGDKK